MFVLFKVYVAKLSEIVTVLMAVLFLPRGYGAAGRLDTPFLTVHSPLSIFFPVALQPYRALADRAAAAGQRI